MSLVQAEIDAIYVGNNAYDEAYIGYDKIRPETEIPPHPDEAIVLRMKTDSYGQLRIPTARDRYETLYYDWQISIDGGTAVQYSGSAGYNDDYGITITGLNYNTDVIVIITPTTVSYGRAKAFTYKNSNRLKYYIKDVLYDESYIGYADSATDTGDYFRAYQYKGCTLGILPKETLPYGVTTIGDYFRAYQFSGCQITTPPEEYIPSSVTTIGDYFRAYQYTYSTIIEAPTEYPIQNVTTIGGYFRSHQYERCSSLITASTRENAINNLTSISDGYRVNQYAYCTSLTSTSRERDIDIPIGDNFKVGQYANCTSLVSPAREGYINTTTIGNSFRGGQYAGCTSLYTTAEEGTIYTDSIGTYFRANQYSGSGIVVATNERSPDSINSSLSIDDYFRAYQFSGCANLTATAREDLSTKITHAQSRFRLSQYENCVALITAYSEVLGGIANMVYSFRERQYAGCTSLEIGAEENSPNTSGVSGSGERREQYDGCSSLKQITLDAWSLQSSDIYFRSNQFRNAGNNLVVTFKREVVDGGISSAGLTTSTCSQIRVPSSLLSAYQSASNWSAVSSLFVGY